ncbi:MAG: hypothetical protein M1380_02340 [Chloroflexi bacterium]|nr:hypothetical protein [Chloroflexota bacterium]MCL5026714.1 hypothetical protein [Chloroflexota bacterium]
MSKGLRAIVVDDAGAGEVELVNPELFREAAARLERALTLEVEGTADERAAYAAAFVESAGYFVPAGSPLPADPRLLDPLCGTINGILGTSLEGEDAFKIGQHIVSIEREFNQKAMAAA